MVGVAYPGAGFYPSFDKPRPGTEENPGLRSYLLHGSHVFELAITAALSTRTGVARRAFSQVAPRVCNDLSIENCNYVKFDRFRSALGTHYYRLAFDNNCTS